MKAGTREIHVFGCHRSIQQVQNMGYPLSVVELRKLPMSGREKLFKFLLFERFNHHAVHLFTALM